MAQTDYQFMNDPQYDPYPYPVDEDAMTQQMEQASHAYFFGRT
jgi:hypothetical protein